MSFTDCISEINNTKIDNAMIYLMPMYDLIEYSGSYSKKSGSLSQYYIHELSATILNSKLFKSKIRLRGKNPADANVKDVKIVEPLNYLRNFWRTLETPLINCETNFILTWSEYVLLFLQLKQQDLQ